MGRPPGFGIFDAVKEATHDFPELSDEQHSEMRAAAERLATALDGRTGAISKRFAAETAALVKVMGTGEAPPPRKRRREDSESEAERKAREGNFDLVEVKKALVGRPFALAVFVQMAVSVAGLTDADLVVEDEDE
jgi:hypothetical protein